MNITFSELRKLHADLARYMVNRKLRRQFQPKTIRKLILNGMSGGAVKAHIGCGGGKTTIFMLALAWLYLHGKIKRIVVIAPTIVLTRQLEREFSELMDRLLQTEWADKGIRLKGKFPIINVSSDSDNKKDDTWKAEHEGVEDIDIEEAKNHASYKHLVHVTERRAEELQGWLAKPMAAFFVCLPSWHQNFRHQVEVARARIDVTVFDEYHNLINQRKEDANVLLRALQQNVYHSRSRWFFSASKKEGPVMKSTDQIFGQEIANVKSSQLVKWGYLVPNLRITFATAGSVKGVSEALEKHFKDQGIKQPAAFYREWAVIERALTEMKERGEVPQGIMFGSQVAIMRQLLNVPLFRERLETLVPGIKLYGVFGNTPKDERVAIFDEVKSAPADQAFLVLNHSVIKEGVDVTRFNCLLLMRGMNEIGLQQALGRVQRMSPGKLTAHTFLFIDGDDNDTIKRIIAETFEKIQWSLGDIVSLVSGLVEDQRGDTTEEDQVFPNYGQVTVPWLMTAVQLAEYAVRRNMSVEDQLADIFA